MAARYHWQCRESKRLFLEDLATVYIIRRRKSKPKG
jgi:hypothetical protein